MREFVILPDHLEEGVLVGVVGDGLDEQLLVLLINLKNKPNARKLSPRFFKTIKTFEGVTR